MDMVWVEQGQRNQNVAHQSSMLSEVQSSTIDHRLAIERVGREKEHEERVVPSCKREIAEKSLLRTKSHHWKGIGDRLLLGCGRSSRETVNFDFARLG